MKQIESAGARCSVLEVESDMTIRACYENNMDLTGLNKKACDCLLWLEVEFETGIFDVSLKHRVPLNGEKGIPYNNRDFLVTDRRGYQSILESTMIKPMDKYRRISHIRVCTLQMSSCILNIKVAPNEFLFLLSHLVFMEVFSYNC